MTERTVASAIIDSQKKWKRKAADFYPTPTDVTVALMEFLLSIGAISKGTFAIEPACGDGSMAAVLEQYGLTVQASDLRFSGYGTPGVDFLGEAYSNGADWVITNPPFNLSVPFITKSLRIAPNVAMLLKSQYWHAANRFQLFQNHRPEWILPLTWRPAFLEDERGSSPLMDVIWVVWRQHNEDFPKFRPIPRPKVYLEPRTNIDLVLCEWLG